MTFAMAQQGKFFQWAGKIHPRFGTPGNALLLHLLLMIVFVLSGSFYTLADMYIFIIWLFNLMLVAGVFVLRKKMPNAERPYRLWGYPFIPLVVLLFNIFYLVITVYNYINNYVSGKTHIINSVFGLVLVSIGIPFYWYFKKSKTPS